MGVLGRVILQNSLAGSLLILLILVFRWATRRTSKLYAYILWLLLLLVLFVPPVTGLPFWTARSLVPELGTGTAASVKEEQALNLSGNPAENQETASETGLGELKAEDSAAAQSGEQADPAGSSAGTEPGQMAGGLNTGSLSVWEWMTLAWAVGAGGLVVFHLVQWLRLRRKTAAAVREKGSVWRTDEIETPFVMPGFPSRIYLPFFLEGQAYADVLAHERRHIRHGDPWIKCLYVAALTIHWFNPLVWLAFRLMGRDMEMFCDECVLKGKSMREKKRYSQTLLDLACRENRFSLALYFGENSTRSRIRHILYGKRPHILVSLLCLALISGCGVTFMATGGEDEEVPEQISGLETPGEGLEEMAEAEPEEALSEEELSWNQKAVVGTGYPDTEQDFALEELSLLAETEQFALYSMHEGSNLLVKAPDGCMIYSEAPAVSGYGIEPLLNEGDYDGDGENELAVITCVQHGTGVRIDSLLMVDHTEDSSWKIYQYLASDYLKILSSYFSTTYEGSGVRLLFDASRGGMEAYAGGPVGVTEYVEQEELDHNYAYHIGSQIDFRFVEGTIWLRAELEGYSDIRASGHFPGHALETTVGYLGEGSWDLASDVRYLDVNIDNCIERGLSLYFTGRTEEFYESYAAENFRPVPFDHVCQRMTLLSISYPWDNLDSGEAKAYAAVRLDNDDSLYYLTIFLQDTGQGSEDMRWKIRDLWIEK